MDIKFILDLPVNGCGLIYEFSVWNLKYVFFAWVSQYYRVNIVIYGPLHNEATVITKKWGTFYCYLSKLWKINPQRGMGSGRFEHDTLQALPQEKLRWLGDNANVLGNKCHLWGGNKLKLERNTPRHDIGGAVLKGISSLGF